jgi:hypothetical protein
MTREYYQLPKIQEVIISCYLYYYLLLHKNSLSKYILYAGMEMS